MIDLIGVVVVCVVLALLVAVLLAWVGDTE